MSRYQSFFVKHRSSLLYDLGAALLLVAILLFYISLVARGYPQTNSDESTMGLMARHILYQGKPVWMFYGQDYMGSIEAYLGAFFFLFLGPSVFALRLGVILEFTLFLLCLYLLASLLYSRKIALFSLLLACVGPRELLFSHVVAAGGPMEVLCFGALLSLIAVYLTLTYPRQTLSRRQRLLLYGLWGLLAGLSIWSDPLILPFVLLPGLLLLVFCWREVCGVILALVLLCALIGFSPYLFFFLTVPSDQIQSHLLPFLLQPAPTPSSSPIHSIVTPQPTPQPTPSHVPTSQPQWTGDNGQPVPAPTLTQRILGTLVIALPLATGGDALCSLSSQEAWPLSAQSSPHLLQCTAIHGLWGLAHIFLWTIAAYLALQCFRVAWRKRITDAPLSSSSTQSYQCALLQASRLMLLAAAALGLLLYTISQTPALIPWSSSRYLVGLHIATPAVLFGLWEITRPLKKRLPLLITLQSLRYILVFLLLGVLAFGTLQTLDQLPSIQADNAKDSALIAQLERQHVRTFYSDYWTCDHLIFLSQERLICSVLDEKLQFGLDRYLPYRAMVQHDPRAAYLFKIDSPQAKAFALQLPTNSIHYSYQTLSGYLLYQPLTGSAYKLSESLAPEYEQLP